MSESDASVADAALRAAAWDRIHPGSSGDVAYYVEACRGSGGVLELGVGTGRVAAALVRAGLRVVGIERDAARLRACRAALGSAVGDGLHLQGGDVRAMDLGRVFDRIIAPYNLLCALGDDAGVAACLERVARHLAPGGRFIADVYAVDEDVDLRTSDAFDTPERVSPWVDGEWLYEVSVEDRLTRDPRRMEAVYTIVARQAGSGSTRRLREVVPHLALPAGRLRELVEAAGLRVLSLDGGFRGEAPDAVAQHFVVVAERPLAPDATDGS